MHLISFDILIYFSSYYLPQVENAGSDTVSEILLAFPDSHANYLAYLKAALKEGKGKAKSSFGAGLPYEIVQPKDAPASLKFIL